MGSRYERKIHTEKVCQCGFSFMPTRSDQKYCRRPDCTRNYKTQFMAQSKQLFQAVDGEGVGKGDGHRYVLLGVGSVQKEWPDGVQNIESIFDFLYRQFLLEPERIYVGFYLTYDWNMWLRLLPRERAWRLLDDKGKYSRRRKDSGGNPIPFPVRHNGWEFDILWGKRFKLRPQSKKGESPAEWFYLCDAGPFFQSSLLKALKNRSENCQITDDEVAIIEEGKGKRASAELDDDMRLYNQLENKALEALMEETATNFRKLGVRLGRTEFHGPGQAAEKWALKQPQIMTSVKAAREIPFHIAIPIVSSYYGGIFEVIAHGHVKGLSYEYDINSAYPHAATQLRCMCGDWVEGEEGFYTLYKCEVMGDKDRIFGPLPFRRHTRKILRPTGSQGWFWKHEIEAAAKLGIVDKLNIEKTIGYIPCNHPNPVTDLQLLYQTRLSLGKDSALGKAIKLIVNSLYGKFAQSIGNPKVSNAVYASLITSFCRTQILRAITSHPKGLSALLMIATDAVFFSDPHPGLSLTEDLGDWEETERSNLTIFKPGMYWDDKARRAIETGKNPIFKSRGVKANDFQKWVYDIDTQFNHWYLNPPGIYFTDANGKPLRIPRTEGYWPIVEIPMGFNQISVKAALRWTEEMADKPAQIAKYNALAGRVSETMKVKQVSMPILKRDPNHLAEDFDGRIWRSRSFRRNPHKDGMSLPYDGLFGFPEEIRDFNAQHSGMDEPLDIAYFEALGLD